MTPQSVNNTGNVVYAAWKLVKTAHNCKPRQMHAKPDATLSKSGEERENEEKNKTELIPYKLLNCICESHKINKLQPRCQSGQNITV